MSSSERQSDSAAYKIRSFNAYKTVTPEKFSGVFSIPFSIFAETTYSVLSSLLNVPQIACVVLGRQLDELLISYFDIPLLF